MFQLSPISVPSNKEPTTFTPKCVIFFLQNHSNCRDVKMGGWASLFSGLSRRIPDSVTQRAVAAYFTGEIYEFVGRESLSMAGHLNLNIFHR